jgi:hypothetical protein
MANPRPAPLPLTQTVGRTPASRGEVRDGWWPTSAGGRARRRRRRRPHALPKQTKAVVRYGRAPNMRSSETALAATFGLSLGRCRWQGGQGIAQLGDSPRQMVQLALLAFLFIRVGTFRFIRFSVL